MCKSVLRKTFRFSSPSCQRIATAKLESRIDKEECEMNIPAFSAEVSIYKTSGYYSAPGRWAPGFESYLGPSQFALPPLPNGGGCKPHIGPCLPDPSCISAQDPVGHSRTVLGSDCSVDTICCPVICRVTCGPCTGGSCGSYPTCMRSPGTQTCTDCNQNTSTRSC